MHLKNMLFSIKSAGAASRPRSPLFARRLVALLLAALLAWPGAYALADQVEVNSAIEAFRKAQAEGSEYGMEQATKKLMQNFNDWEKWAMSNGSDPALAKAIDEKMVTMTKEVWSEIATKTGGVDRVVPVGSLGGRNKPDSKYIIGKSDKDLIPMGPRAKESVQEFNEAFTRKFGVKPESAKINILDPTDPSTWKGRLDAVENIEKYNTVGGNKWLKNELYKTNNDVWSLGPNGALKEVPYREAVSAPEALTKADAAGFFSDNTKFRSHFADLSTNERMLMQSKYDLRNIEAYELAGGKLTSQERALMEAAEMARKGNVDDAIKAYGKAVGSSGDDAARAYLAAMDEFTTKMGKKVFTEHIALIKARPGVILNREMAGAINNLPIDLAEKIGKEVGESSAYSRVIWDKADEMADEILKHPGIQSQIDNLFNTRARNAYGKAYDALSDSERAALHGSFEEASNLGSKLGLGLAAAGAAWALYDAVNTGYQEGGLSTAAGYGFGRLVLEAAQYGYPPLVFAELAARAMAFGVAYGAGQLQQGTLDALYKLYKDKPDATNLSDIIQYDSASGKFASGLREFAKELRAQAAKQGKTLTNADIDKALRDYLTRRYNNEQLAASVDKFKNQAKAWISKNGVSLIPGGTEWDTQRLEEQDPEAYNRLILNLMLKHRQIMDKLKKDGILDVERNAWYLLKILYNNGPEAYEKALSELYASYDKVYPPPNGEGCPNDCRTRVIKVRDTSRELANMPKHSEQNIAKAGVIATIGGGFQEHGVDEACDPPIKQGPFTLAVGGKIEAEIAGSPPVPQKWSLGNRNTGLQVWYEPKLPRGGFGPGQRLISISGDIKTGKAKQSADVPGPGRLTLVASAPSGNGPLSGSCFGQSFNGKVTLTEVSKAMPAARGMDIKNGDTIKTGPNGRILIDISCRGMILMESNAEVQMDKDGRSFKVLKGTVQIKSRKGCKAPAVEAGGKIVVPKGTEYRVEVGKDDQVKVKVLSGSVEVEDSQNPQDAKRVHAGYELDAKTGQEKKMTPPRGSEGEYDGLNLEQLMEVDDSQPEPYGEHPLKYYGRRFHDGWVWEDPKDDAKVSAIDGGIKVDVPDGNNFWYYHNGAPRLMHKVTGDFDLDLGLQMACEGNHQAYTEFFIYAQGSHLGLLNKQAKVEDAGVDHLLMGGIWQRNSNRNKLPFWDYQPYNSPDAPDKPVLFRLSRRGHWFYSQWSADGGKTWQVSGRRKLMVAETIYTGLMFKRIAEDGKRQAMAENTITGMTLVSKPAGSMSLPRWLRQEIYGRIEAQGDGGKFIHTKEHVALNRLILAGLIDGDFNAVALVDLGDGERGQGGVIAGLEIIAEDETVRANVKLVNTFKHNRRYASDMTGQRGGWPFEPAVNKTWLRLNRIGGTVSSYYWLEGEWVLIKTFDKPLPGEVNLCLFSQTDSGVREPMATEVIMDLEYLALGPDAAKPYEPKSYELLAKLAPPALQLPQGVTASLYQTPYPMMNPFFDNAGNIYLLPAAKKKQAMIMLPPGGPAALFRQGDALTGENWKRGLWAGDRLLITVDGWSGGGNRLSGLYEIGPDGKATETGGKLARGGGLSALMAQPDGSLIIADFEYNRLWRTAPDGNETELYGKEKPTCVYDVAPHARKGSYYLRNNSEGYSCNKQSGVYIVDEKGGLRVLYAAPDNKNLGGMAWLNKGIYPAGLYISQPQTGEVLRIIGKDKAQPVLKGLEDPRTIAASPDGSAIALMLGVDKLLVLRGAAAQAAVPTAAPAAGGTKLNGLWAGPGGETYFIKQEGAMFRWTQVEPPSGQVGNGTIVGDKLTVRWRGTGDSGSATGSVIRRDGAGKPLELSWGDGRTFKRVK